MRWLVNANGDNRGFRHDLRASAVQILLMAPIQARHPVQETSERYALRPRTIYRELRSSGFEGAPLSWRCAGELRVSRKRSEVAYSARRIEGASRPELITMARRRS